MKTTTNPHEQRFQQKLTFDISCLEDETSWLIGVDEVGRGSLAGPVVAAAVAISTQTLQHWQTEPPKALWKLTDSKKLSPTARENLSRMLLSIPNVIATQGWVDAAEIDRLNIHHATLNAMAVALHDISKLLLTTCQAVTSIQVLVDGKWLVPNQCLSQIVQTWRQKAVIQGDGRSLVIAAASVIAKHHRDAWMMALANDYPDYHFQQHKGYGTKAHRLALGVHGASPYHRQSFLKKFRNPANACLTDECPQTNIQ
ncbi:MAG: ribonuclease HII [Vampirovibrionales bacterium]|nr:ribonuclease HII [Vampirovibrionales bacterium]